MARVYLGIGSNLGDRQANVERAIALLKEHEDIRVQAVSSLRETQPVGGPPQGPYLNGAVELRTDLRPLELLSWLKNIERRLGRVKTAAADSPRPMDLDILLYDDVVIVDGKHLTVPHPRMTERLFVLEPLAEIAPEAVHPRTGKTVAALLEELRREAAPDPAGA